jgi:holo-[acyl-carrier protein] synthase
MWIKALFENMVTEPINSFDFLCVGEDVENRRIYVGEFMNEWNIGVDAVEVARFRLLDYPSYKQFYERVFTSKEIEYCLSFKTPASHFAVNFAGKEAVYKAINKFYDVKLRDIEILRDKDGAPHVNLHLNHHGAKNDRQRIRLPLGVKVSLSHSSSYAIAFAVVNVPLGLIRDLESKMKLVSPDES